jgi:DNA repair protein RadA/Sms
MGKCPDCGTWDSLVEHIEARGSTARASSAANLAKPVLLRDITTESFTRLPVLGEEFARVLGGGLVPGSVVLIGGDPGIGKTTLLTQAGAYFANQAGSVLYVSAEESAQQIKLRTERLGLDSNHLYIYSETNLDAILEQINQLEPKLAIIDSIQTVYLEDVVSAAGSVSQVREGALRLLRLAKKLNIPMFLVGHVTKEGAIAGPRVLEHIVDAVLYMEGDRFHQYRLLRSVKNRFGSTNEVGVFEMTQEGMCEVANPSQAFLSERSAGAPGSTVAVTLEGTRPILVEVQALTSHTSSAQPRRTTNGFDMNRLLMLIAVLSKRVGLPLFNQDVYVNIVGGLRINEPAADVAVAMAIVSSYRNQRIDPDLVFIGEIGLSGELRSVSQIERRLSEAAKLGFQRALTPILTQSGTIDNLEIHPTRSLAEVVALMTRVQAAS